MTDMDQRNDIHEKYRRGLWRVPEIPSDSILGVQLAKQSSDDLGLMDKRLPPLPSREKMIEVLVTVLVENPWVKNSDRNGSMIASWLDKEGLAFTLQNVRGAVKVLQNDLEKAKPQPPPPAAPPPEPEEILAPGQLSLNASELEMRRATPAQLKDLIKRQQAAKRKK